MLLKKRVMCLVLAASAIGVGCWGDEVPSLDQVGALRTEDGQVTILFGACPGETVQRVELRLTDDNFNEIVRVLWAVEADDAASTPNAFTVGQLPPGFREVTPLDERLKPDDHLQLVVTTSEQGTIPMSFDIDDLRTDDVLVRMDRYRSRDEFDSRVNQRCDRG